jgi:hypothetical protein
MSKNQNDVSEAVALAVQAKVMTIQILLRVFKEYLHAQNEKAQLPGETTLAKLHAQAGGTLDNIKITDKNIGSFNETAVKYNLSYALKKDSDTVPPTWYVFFKQDKNSKDTMDRAIKEFVARSDIAAKEKPPIITREGIGDIDLETARNDAHAKEREHDEPDLSDLPEPEEPEI